MRKPGPAYSLERVVINIDDALGVRAVKKRLRVDSTYVVYGDTYIDVLDHYEKIYGITFNKEASVERDEAKIHEIVSWLKDLLNDQGCDGKLETSKIISNIEEAIEGNDCEINIDLTIYDNDQLVDILEYFEIKYGIKFPFELLGKRFTIGKLREEIVSLYKQQEAYLYIIIYAKLVEDKLTKESYMEGPYFGEHSHSEKLIEEKAKKLTENQQNNAILIKIFKKDGRSDAEIMNLARRYFNKVRSNMEFN